MVQQHAEQPGADHVVEVGHCHGAVGPLQVAGQTYDAGHSFMAPFQVGSVDLDRWEKRGKLLARDHDKAHFGMALGCPFDYACRQGYVAES